MSQLFLIINLDKIKNQNRWLCLNRLLYFLTPAIATKWEIMVLALDLVATDPKWEIIATDQKWEIIVRAANIPATFQRCDLMV